MRVEIWLEKLYENTFGRPIGPYVSIIKFSHGRWSVLRRVVMTLGVLVILVLSVNNVMPVIGKNLMPPMDTGIIKAHVKFSANETVDSSEKRLKPFIKRIHDQPEVVMSSITFGSEPGVLYLGSGLLPSEAKMTINCLNRFERKSDIWQIEDEIRSQLMALKNVKSVDGYDFGPDLYSHVRLFGG